MKPLLIVAGLYLAMLLLGWLCEKYAGLPERMSYKRRMGKLSRQIKDVDISTFESEATRLQAVSQSLFEKLRTTHRIQDVSAPKAISDYVQADADYQKARRRKSEKPKPERRRWRYY